MAKKESHGRGFYMALRYNTRLYIHDLLLLSWVFNVHGFSPESHIQNLDIAKSQPQGTHILWKDDVLHHASATSHQVSPCFRCVRMTGPCTSRSSGAQISCFHLVSWGLGKPERQSRARLLQMHWHDLGCQHFAGRSLNMNAFCQGAHKL